MSNSQELKGIREEKPLRERGVIILFSEAGWGLFDRMVTAESVIVQLQAQAQLGLCSLAMIPRAFL